MPFTITQRLAGYPLVEEQRSAVTDNPALPGDEFQVPPQLQGQLDPELASYGKRSSTYLLRTQEYGAAIYVDLSAYLQPAVLSSAPGAGVVHYLIGGYNSLAIEMATSIVVVEAPLYEAASRAVIDDVKRRWPGKPITALASTHFHYDHSGGVRTYAAEGAEIFVPAQTAQFYRTMMAAPHTLHPDALARSPRPVAITAVADQLSLTEGARTVTFYNLAQSHSDGCLVAIVEDAKVLFTSDLYNPGGLGPNPTGPEKPFHDTYARELIRGLAELGITPTSEPTMQFAGGHGGVGTWSELQIFAGL